jgi:hypothetical protein
MAKAGRLASKTVPSDHTIVEVINKLLFMDIIANEVKQSPEIATPAGRNFIPLSIPVFKHSSVQARRPAKPGLLAMTTLLSRLL